MCIAQKSHAYAFALCQLVCFHSSASNNALFFFFIRDADKGSFGVGAPVVALLDAGTGP